MPESFSPNQALWSSRLIVLSAALLLSGCTSVNDRHPFISVTGTEALSNKLHVPIEEPTGAVISQNRYGPINCANPDQNSLSQYEPIFVEEFSYYPVTAIKRSGLQEIILCRALDFEGAHRTALPDYDHDAFYLDVERGGANQEYQRKVIHHEFFHIIDWKDDGLVYSDDAWASLNANGFKYGRGGKFAQKDPRESVFDGSLKGFVTRYAMSGVEEDKAETFANMMVNYQLMEKRVENDPVLKSKFVRMKQVLISFDNSFNDHFWALISKRTPVSSP